jgi:hypothetical protein
MPCHGDLGQGLTDEFRMVWEEDHQDCWDSGCHGGRERDEGFPIPTIVPAVMGTTDHLPWFTTPQQLFEYLEATHPPQAPGRLTDEETWQIVALLWSGNHKPEVNPALPRLSTASPSPAPTSPASPPTTSDTSAGGERGQGLTVCGIGILFPFLGLVAPCLLTRRSKH